MNEILHECAIAELESIDSKFSFIRANYGLPPLWRRPQGFETLCKIILEQQVSLESGKAAYVKLNSILPAFEPEHILKLSDHQMRGATISRQKSSYIRALSFAILEGSLDLSELNKLDIEECRQRLLKVKGIGPWTANVYMMFALQKPDIFPAGDIALITAAKELWQLTSKEEILKHSSQWSPHRTTASYFLWHFYLKVRNRNPVL